MKRCMKTFLDLMKMADGNRKYVICLFLSSALYTFTSILPPIATSGIILMITSNNFLGIWFYVFLYLAFYSVYFAAKYWNYYVFGKLADYYHMEVQRKLFLKIANNENILDKFSKGKIIDTCSDDIRYLVDVVDCSVEIIMNLIKLIVIITIFLFSNIYVAIMVLLWVATYLYFMNDNSRKVSKAYDGTRKYEDKIMDTFNQVLVNLKSIKVLNLMPNLDKNIDKSRKKWSQYYEKKNINLRIRYGVIPYIIYIGKIFLYVYLAYLVINGKMSLDKLILLISYYEMTVTCTDTMLAKVLDLSNYGVRVNRIKNILNYTPQQLLAFGEYNNDYITGKVEFKNVSYQIKNERILKDVSFSLYPNCINVIVGKDGSGKTTIMDLLYRLYKVKSGTIFIDDEDIYHYSKDVYFSNVSGVFQKPFVFEMSIKDNLSLIDSNVNQQTEVCKMVGIHDFIESLPKGYNAIIQEGRGLLNESQLQLLVIARAILSKAEILLFDEVTDKMDVHTLRKLKHLFLELKEDHTVIIVSKVKEMIELADQIVVLDNGAVDAVGTIKEVEAKSKIFKEIIEIDNES